MKHLLPQFSSLSEAWALAKDDIQMAHELDETSLEFVCHHNAYIAYRSLCNMEIANIHLVTGMYHAGGELRIKHSWLAFPEPQDPVAIFEYDPNQLKKAGNHVNDKMPSWEMSDNCRISSVVIVDGTRIEHPDYPYIIDDFEVMARYSPSDIDFDLPIRQLDALFDSVVEHKRGS